MNLKSIYILYTSLYNIKNVLTVKLFIISILQIYGYFISGIKLIHLIIYPLIDLILRCIWKKRYQTALAFDDQILKKGA